MQTLLPYNGQFFDHAFVTNDRGDPETDSVVRRLLPSATLLSHSVPLGHHRSVDEMYALVQTPYIFHCEDDWAFDPVPFIPIAHAAITSAPNISHVSMRQTESFRRHYGRQREFSDPVPVGSGHMRRLAEAGWRGYGFNPSLVPKSVWQAIGPFAKYADEGAINNAVEAIGLERVFVVPGVYYHLGDGRHVTDVHPATAVAIAEQQQQQPQPSLLSRIRRRLLAIAP
ncbi:MAG: hypothetical protein JSS14_24050 [Proteobacteria bacterium]|nr:hypothetical protein [Pseudomonadota bacterium]